MKTLPMVQCQQCLRFIEFTPEDVVEKRWDFRYEVNCLCRTGVRLPMDVVRDLGLNKKKEEEVAPPKKEEKPAVDKVQRAIDTAMTVKRLGSKSAAAKEMEVSITTVTNYLKYLPVDMGTEE